MSTLKVDTLQSTGGGATTFTKQQAIKTWVNYDAADQATRGSFGQSSLADNGTGDFTHAFSNSFNSLGRYSVSGVAQDLNSKNAQINYMSSDASLDAASIRYQTGYVANTSGGQTNHDCNSTSMTIHGDLA